MRTYHIYGRFQPNIPKLIYLKDFFATESTICPKNYQFIETQIAISEDQALDKFMGYTQQSPKTLAERFETDKFKHSFSIPIDPHQRLFFSNPKPPLQLHLK